MLKVIGAGFPRTGTTSMKAALEQLGLGPCHHMFEVIQSPAQQGKWRQVIESDGRADWGWALEGYQSSVDWPSSYYWRELMAAYPDAKVLLTVRDPHRWYASVRDTIFTFTREGARAEQAGQRPPNPIAPVLGRLWAGTFGEQMGEEMPAEDHAVDVFERHIATVRETVPADRLLVHEARDGWEPLCDFLGVPEPDSGYPHLNDGDTMRRMAERARTGDIPDGLTLEDLRKSGS
ncbi:hypothetical protein SAMN05421678_103436 [Actinopolymorpha cephalotaxi]|uniref:Sulfotransferase family protein n=1 Tax=Actinopolymorpha cephalotaxi TaxID=504797 RepID=A0A1I2NPI2_9ACTN|nr:sulfotransferase family protein [Actinopolymorpha cephalotaxi]NYH85456.1 hypothetical protein [Actinopolymorpha cephalotaxi]SFG04659.1 hypothetical protein SAMN05421678_103436 [Actinopolymorpha cephalotaxi]